MPKSRVQGPHKIIVIGDPCVGKSSLIGKFFNENAELNPKYQVTTGVDFVTKTLDRGSQGIRLQLWDIAGQERFTKLHRVFFKAAVGCVIVCDCTRKPTFENVATWKSEVDDKVTLPDGSRIPCILLANKCDLESIRTVTQEELADMAKRLGFIGYSETSALTGANIVESMRELVERIVLPIEKAEKVLLGPPDDREPDTVALRYDSGTQRTPCCGGGTKP